MSWWLPKIWFILLLAYKNAHISLTPFQGKKSKKIPSYHYLVEISEFLSDVWEPLHQIHTWPVLIQRPMTYELIKQVNKWYVPQQYLNIYWEGVSSSLLSMVSRYKLWRYFLFHYPPQTHLKETLENISTWGSLKFSHSAAPGKVEMPRISLSLKQS